MSLSNTVLTFLVSFSITYLVLPRLSNLASRVGLLDQPGRRKVHAMPKPLVGGIGMMIGISLGCLLFIPLAHLRGFYAGIFLLVIIGFLDDFRELSHRWKFVGQVLAALSMIYFSNTVLLSLGNLLSFGPITFNRASVFLTVFSAVGVINAMNMIDGVDGLAGGVSLVAFSAFAVLALISGQTELLMLNVAFMGALTAFLRYNWHPSRLFMGDAGSLALGFALTFMSVAITQRKGSTVPPVAALLIMAVPVVDTLTVMLKRSIQDKNPFHADRSHLHHICLRFGVGKKATSMTITGVTALFSLCAIAGTVWRIPEYYLFSFFMTYFVCYFISSFYLKQALIYWRRAGKGREAGTSA